MKLTMPSEAHELIMRAHQLLSQNLIFYADDWRTEDVLAFGGVRTDLALWLHTYRDTPFAEAITQLEAFYYTDAELAQWLNAPHPQFDGKSAIQMLAEGKKKEVCACVQRLDEGAYL